MIGNKNELHKQTQWIKNKRTKSVQSNMIKVASGSICFHHPPHEIRLAAQKSGVAKLKLRRFNSFAYFSLRAIQSN